MVPEKIGGGVITMEMNTRLFSFKENIYVTLSVPQSSTANIHHENCECITLKRLNLYTLYKIMKGCQYALQRMHCKSNKMSRMLDCVPRSVWM